MREKKENKKEEKEYIYLLFRCVFRLANEHKLSAGSDVFLFRQQKLM